MADLNNQDHQSLLRNCIDDTVVANANAIDVVAGEFHGSGGAGIILQGFDPGLYAALQCSVEASQSPDGPGGVFDPVCHAYSPNSRFNEA